MIELSIKKEEKVDKKLVQVEVKKKPGRRPNPHECRPVSNNT